jgi:hypothetical protein
MAKANRKKGILKGHKIFANFCGKTHNPREGRKIVKITTLENCNKGRKKFTALLIALCLENEKS